MSDVVIINSDTLVDAARAGMQIGQPYTFLNDLLSGPNKPIINSVSYQEAINGSNQDAQVIHDWLVGHANDYIFDDLGYEVTNNYLSTIGKDAGDAQSAGRSATGVGSR
jgi:hypothetical protein